MKKENNIAFANVSCPTSSELKNLRSISIVAGEKIFFEIVSYANTVENIKQKLVNWLSEFDDKVFINTTRQKDIGVIKSLLNDTIVKNKVKIKVYLKMIFEEMFSELKSKGFSLLRISFLYDLSQSHFENSYEKYYMEEKTTGANTYAADLSSLQLAKANRRALMSTIEYLRSLEYNKDE